MVLSYGRRGTTTAHALMSAVSDLEGGDACWLFPTGAAAIATALQAFLRSGDHLLVTETVFHATKTICDQFLRPNGVNIDMIPYSATDLSYWIRPETKVVFVESPGSNTLEVMDLPAIAESAHANNVLVIADNTYGSGWLYRPLELGCDVSIIAGTKYLSGHADVMMGTATARGDAVVPLRKAVVAAGQTLSPDDAYLTLRALRTLHLRMERHQQNTLQVLRWFEQQECVLGVFHPALPNHPGHETWLRDASGTNGIVSVVFVDAFDQKTFLDSLKVFAIGGSWGGFESLVKAFALRDDILETYQKTQRDAIRFHVGLEHIDDILEDLEQAMTKVS